MPFEKSELISFISIGVAALSALYARWSAIQARKANEISIKAELKPHRLAVFNILKTFLHFCSTYRTMQCIQMVKGTQDLTAKIDDFKWEVDKHGPLNMPEIDELISKAINNAWQLQRALDSLPKPSDSTYDSATEKMNGLLEWFDTNYKNLMQLFEPYLKI